MINKTIRAIMVMLTFCLLFIETGKLLRYILIDDTHSYTRVTYHEMYEQDNIDVLFVGTSHCYRSFNPDILDKELCQNTFNAGSSAQPMDGSLILIKEALKNNDVEQIYLEMYFGCAFEDKKDRNDPTSTYIISDYLRPSVDKYRYLLNATGKEHYANSFIVARRNWIKLFDLDYITDVIIKKGDDAYKNYNYTNITGDKEWYAGKGYVANSGIVHDWNYFSTNGWQPICVDKISNDWRLDLERIIDLCNRNNVSLTLIGAPMSNFLITGVGDYDEYIAYINEIVEGTNVDYYDFNLCKEKYFPNTSELFYDEQHLNYHGAETFCHAFAQLVNGEVKPTEMFYNNYEEKMQNISATVFGVSYRDNALEDEIISRECRIITNDNTDWEFKIEILPMEGAPYVLREYSKEKIFVLSPDEKGECLIKYKLVGNYNEAQEIRLTIPES